MAQVPDLDPVIVIDDSLNKNSTLNLGLDSGLASSNDLSTSNPVASNGPHVSILSSISGANVGHAGRLKFAIKIYF